MINDTDYRKGNMTTFITSAKSAGRKIIFLLVLSLLILTGAGAQQVSISVNDAVRLAVTSDTRVKSALLDIAASRARVAEARRNRYPSITIRGGYTRLSPVTSHITLGPTSMDIKSQDDNFNLSANLQYPVFAGFRLNEAVKLAKLQAKGTEVSSAISKNTVVFETRRAYWEAVRTNYNVNMLRKNLTLMNKNRDLLKEKLSQGTVLKADFLSASMRSDQAEMDLENAISFQKRAFLNLETLLYSPEQLKANLSTIDAGSPLLPFILVSKPEDPALLKQIKTKLSGKIDESALIRQALSKRSETRAASLAVDMARTGMDMAKAPLYPTLALTGNYTYANPNQRVLFQSNPEFTGTWSLGISLSYNIGSIPAEMSELAAKNSELQKSISAKERQEKLVIQDVRRSLLSYTQARKNMELVSKMLNQAIENERVTSQRVKTGMAGNLDLLRASIARLRSEFSIVNKQIDLQIAAAGLCRAAALTEF